MPPHLMQRAGVYYYRRRVPDDVRALVGKAVVQYSLQTKNLKEAKARLHVANVECDARFQHLRSSKSVQLIAAGTTTNVAMDPVELVRRYVADVTERRAGRLANDPPESREQRAEMVREAETGLDMLQDPGDLRGHERVTALEHRLLGKGGTSSLGLTDREAATLFRRALIEADRRGLALLSGEHDRSHFDVLFDPRSPQPTTFAALAEEFLTYKSEEAEVFELSAKSLDKQKTNVKLVLEIIGDARLVRDISFEVCRAACSVLARIPANRTKHYPELNLEEAIARGKSEGKPMLALKTQQQYLAALKELLELAVAKRLLPSNPAERLKPLARDALSAQEKRLPFTSEQLATFFSSKFYQGCASGEGPPFRNTDKPWRFWLPLLMLFMGMRPREICQLQIGDLQRTKKGVWFIDIATTSDEDEVDKLPKKSLKTKASRRQVPLHRELQHAGFVQFVAERRAMKDDPRLFPMLATNKYDDPASYALKQFRAVYLPEAIKMEPRQAVYSFRHTWRDALRRSGATDDAVKSLGGWSEGTTTSDNYGSKLQPDLYAKDIDAVEYEGLDLTHIKVGS